MTYVVIPAVAKDSKSNHRIILLYVTRFMLNFIKLLIIILTLLLPNAFHSEYKDSLGAHNFLGALAPVGGPDPSVGGPGPPRPPRWLRACRFLLNCAGRRIDDIHVAI